MYAFKKFLYENLATIFFSAPNTVVSPNFLVWKFSRKVQFLNSFGRFTQNYVETATFCKISTPKKIGEITVFYAVVVLLKITIFIPLRHIYHPVKHLWRMFFQKLSTTTGRSLSCIFLLILFCGNGYWLSTSNWFYIHFHHRCLAGS